MKGKKPPNIFNRNKANKKEDPIHKIYSVVDFHNIIERERARADRNNHEFSLVVFELHDAKWRDSSIHNIASVVAERKRVTDEVGWLDGKRVGIVLPDTSFEGAKRVADNVSQLALRYTDSLNCKIFTYPSETMPGSTSHQSEHRSSGDYRDIKSEDMERVSNDKDLDLSVASIGSLSYERDEYIEQPSNTQKLSPKELSDLLGCPLPLWKRILDIAGALFGLILLSPLFLLVGLIIKVVSPGPVFFKQERVGYLGRPFTMIKFRTMNVDADISVHQKYLNGLIDSNDTLTKLDDKKDPRIFPFGKILRKAHLDESPQLINVLRGEMSLVGPRPCLPYEAEKFQLWQTRRFDIVPGLTGLWQVGGRNRTSFLDMIRLDINYSKSRSFLLDGKILIKTFPTIVTDMEGNKSNNDPSAE